MEGSNSKALSVGDEVKYRSSWRRAAAGVCESARLCTSSRMAPMGQPTPAADISWMGSVDFVFCYCQVQMGVESTMCGINQSVHFFFVLKKSTPLLQFLIAGEFSSHPM
nr:uncharacterized protein LOC127300795 [Lolium perenne]